MIVRVKYFDFHADNHQGGSGHTVEGSIDFHIPDDMHAINVPDFVEEKVEDLVSKKRPFVLRGPEPPPVTIRAVEIILA